MGNLEAYGHVKDVQDDYKLWTTPACSVRVDEYFLAPSFPQPTTLYILSIHFLAFLNVWI